MRGDRTVDAKLTLLLLLVGLVLGLSYLGRDNKTGVKSGWWTRRGKP